MRIALLVLAASLAACSSGGSSDAHLGDGGGVDAADAAPLSATWTAVYGAYFGAGTPGHCGNAGCHAQTRGGFLCGATKDTCYQGLVTTSLISSKDPPTSPLVDPAASPLTWFGGLMPTDRQGPNEAAAAAVKAWVTAGAKND